MTAKAFVIGHPIGHSRSPMMQGYWIAQHGLDATYDKLDVAPEALPDFFRRFRDEHFIGANVTIPHKLAVMDHVDEIEDVARAMGVTIAELRFLAYHADAVEKPHYVYFEVPKRTGGKRRATAPTWHRNAARPMGRFRHQAIETSGAVADSKGSLTGIMARMIR